MDYKGSTAEMYIIEKVKRGKLAGLAIPPEIYRMAGIDVPVETTDYDKNKISSKIHRRASMKFGNYIDRTYKIEFMNGLSDEEKLWRAETEIDCVSIEFYCSKRYKNCIDKTDGDSTEYTDFYSGFVDGAEATDSAAKIAGNQDRIHIIWEKMNTYGRR